MKCALPHKNERKTNNEVEIIAQVILLAHANNLSRLVSDEGQRLEKEKNFRGRTVMRGAYQKNKFDVHVSTKTYNRKNKDSGILAMQSS